MKRLALLLLLALTPLLPTRSAESAAVPGVLATMFPQYDFARRIGGDRVHVAMLLPPGADAHSYEPTPLDIRGVAKASLLIYAGTEIEPWATRILAAVADIGQVRGVDSSKGIDLIRSGMSEETEGGGEAHGHHDEDGHDHGHVLDPHFWLDPILAAQMAETIAEALVSVDPVNAGYYAENLEALLDDLARLDAECRAMTVAVARRTLVFGGRFAFAYFFRRYGLESFGVYDGCGVGVEPSLRRIAELTAFVGDKGIPVIYHEERVQPRIARAIADESGAALVMAHSLHTLSVDEARAGLTYFDLMRRNLAGFRKGLQ